MSNFIDLRSDSVTRPTEAMRRAMAEAEVGDDVFGEDPTVNRLERLAAESLGKEAALFLPSGTMGNTIAVKLHTRHGQEVICEARSHVLNFELAMMAWFSGCIARPVHAEDGIPQWSQIRDEIRSAGPSRAPTGLVALENTHIMAGGSVIPAEVMTQICDGAHEAGLKVHLDGARIFNAATALGTSAQALAANADTVMVCISKGLGAPVGAVLAGTSEAIAMGRLYRKRLGGGMRQAGVLAAAGIIALETMTKRLGEDHENAQFLAQGLGRVPGLHVPHRVETNIVIFDVGETGLTAAEFAARLKHRGVLINAAGATQLRLLTHYDAGRSACELALAVIEQVAQTGGNR
jgi:threonine aldolase